MTVGNYCIITPYEAGKNQSIDGINLKTSRYLLTHALHLHAHHLDTTRKKKSKSRKEWRRFRGGRRVREGSEKGEKKKLNHAILSSKCHLRKESGR